MEKLVKINAKDYGLEENKAKQISDMFKPMLDAMEELEKEFNEISALKIGIEACKKAKELRLKYVKIRTGTADIHKDLKQFYLLGGRFVDGWKNAQLMASEGIEKKLSDIENHYEIIESERIAKLQEKRVSELSKYEPEPIPENLGEMPEDVWNNYLAGVKSYYEIQKEAARKADALARESERLDKLVIERRGEASEYQQFWDKTPSGRRSFSYSDFRKMTDKEFEILITDLKKAKSDYEIKQEKIRNDNIRLKKEAEAKAKQDKIDADKRAKAEAERDRLAKIEKHKRLKVEAELKAKKDTDIKAEADRQTKIQAELDKDDAGKLKDLLNELNNIKGKYSFKSKQNQKMFDDVKVLIDKVINHINL